MMSMNGFLWFVDQETGNQFQNMNQFSVSYSKDDEVLGTTC